MNRTSRTRACATAIHAPTTAVINTRVPSLRPRPRLHAVILAFLTTMALTVSAAPAHADIFDNDYHPYLAHQTKLSTLALTHPLISTFTPTIGSSVEGRSIPALTIKGTQPIGNKTRLLLVCGHGAREWISIAVCTGLASRYLDAYNSDPAVKALIDAHPIDIIPIVNPDGYAYTWQTTRLWLKNRRKNSVGSFGVNLERNYDKFWGGPGSSGTPSSDTYRGTRAFSEPETMAVSNYVYAHNVGAAIDFGSYGQLILRPWGSGARTAAPRDAQAMAIGNAMRNAILTTPGGVSYFSQRAQDLDPQSGMFADWVLAYKNALAFTILLRDRGSFGNVLPANQIVPSINDGFAASKVLLQQV